MYAIQFVFNGSVRVRYFETLEAAAQFALNIRSVSGVTEVSKPISY